MRQMLKHGTEADMKIQIYTLDISALREDEKLLARYKEAVSRERLARAESFKMASDQARTIGAGILLAIAYEQFWGLTGESADAGSSSCVMKNSAGFSVTQNHSGQEAPKDLPVIRYRALAEGVFYEGALCDVPVSGRMKECYPIDDLCKLKDSLPEEKKGGDGKPYFQSPLYFNISHAGDVAALAIADTDVGIDVEKIRPCKYGVMQRCFSAEEMEYVEAADAEREKELRFVEIWTQKEAMAKLTGGGIADIMQKKKPDGALLRTIRLDDDYILSVSYTCPLEADGAS